MALLFIDGFDHYAIADMGLKWTTTWGGGQNLSIGSSQGRHSSHSFRGTSNQRGWEKALVPGDATCIVGMAYRTGAFALGTSTDLVNVLDGTVTHICLAVNTSGFLEVRRGLASGTILGTSSVGLTLNVYAYIELKVLISDSVGTVDVHLNGSSVLTLTSQDTRNGGTAAWTRVQVSPSVNSTGDIDDLYIADGTGSLNNTFLGDVRVDAHYPTGNGNTSNSTPSTGSDRGALVDETAPNTTDYNTLAATNDKDTLALANLVPTGASILGVQTSVYAIKTDAGPGSMAIVTRSASTDYDGSSTALSTSYTYTTEVRQVDPATSAAFTESNFNALEIGYKRTA